MNKLKLAKNLLENKEKGFSISQGLRRSWKRLLFRVVIITLAVFYYFNVSHNGAFLLGIGILFGATLQDIGWVWRIGKTWSFTKCPESLDHYNLHLTNPLQLREDRRGGAQRSHVRSLDLLGRRLVIFSPVLSNGQHEEEYQTRR